MELYTSYWHNLDLAGLDVIPVGISRGVPRGTLARRLPFRYKRLISLAPHRDLFEHWIAGTIGPTEYTRVYRNYLDTLGPEVVVGQLEKKSADNGGKPLVLSRRVLPPEGFGPLVLREDRPGDPGAGVEVALSGRGTHLGSENHAAEREATWRTLPMYTYLGVASLLAMLLHWVQ